MLATPTIATVTNENIDGVKLVLASVLPVSYPPSFYRDLVQGGITGRVAYYKERIVGCVAWVHEAGVVHVMALGVLATHRERGVATQLLEKCLEVGTGAYLYVQTDNTEAIQFYKRRGFIVTQTVQQYYRRVTCTTAYKMELVR